MQIKNIDLKKMINIKKKYKIEILSPKVLNSTWDFMNKYNNCITFNNALEVYFLLLSPKDFKVYSSINTINNKWMWGVDQLFGHYNIKAAVYMNFSVEHKLERMMTDDDKTTALSNACIHLKKIGIKDFNFFIKNLKKIKKIIKLNIHP